MAGKYQMITKLYQQAIAEVTASPENWTAFLQSACRNYRLPFDEQLLVHVQRPDATAVLSIEQWNKRFGRWVKKGSTGIAVIDKSGGQMQLKHYFDIHDTQESRYKSLVRPVPLWEVKESNRAEVMDALIHSFSITGEDATFNQVIWLTAKNVVSDNMTDYFGDLLPCIEGSRLEELDELNVEVKLRTVLENSVAYMLFTRCGYVGSDFLELEDFESIRDFDTSEVINILGSATSEIAEMPLTEIADTIKKQMHRDRKQFPSFALSEKDADTVVKNKIGKGGKEYGASHIQQTGGLSTAQSDRTTGAGNEWEVRITPSEISDGTSLREVSEPTDTGQIERVPSRDTGDSTEPNQSDDTGNEEIAERDGAVERRESDAVGRSDEQHSSVSGGNRNERNNLPIKEEQETQETSLDSDLPDFPLELLEGVLCHNEFQTKKRNEIQSYFEGHIEYQERADFIKSCYRPEEYTLFDVENHRVGYKALEKGLWVWDGKFLSRSAESFFSWGVVQEMLGDMMDRGQYVDREPYRKLPTESKQLSLFDMQFDMGASPSTFETVSESKSTTRFELSQQVIDEVLASGSNRRGSTSYICANYMHGKSQEENIEFLQNEFKEGGKGFIFDGEKISVWYDEMGIAIAKGESVERASSKLVLSWEQVDKRILELLQLGRFVPQGILDKSLPAERKELAEQLWYLHQDRSGEFPLEESMFEGGFPESTARMSEMFDNPSKLNGILDGLEQFVNAYEQDQSLLRFHFHKPKKLLERLRYLQKEPILFTTEGEIPNTRPMYITQDEVERLLISGSGVSEGKYRIYRYFQEEHSEKERIDFLKKEYGIGGRASTGYNESHDAKGIVYSRGSISEPYDKITLSWKKVSERLEELIQGGRYLSKKELEYIPAYELEILAREVYYFYCNQPEGVVRPYPKGAYDNSAVAAIIPQLESKENVKVILTSMAEILDNTADFDSQYSSMQKTYQNLQDFVDDNYTLFPNIPLKDKEKSQQNIVATTFESKEEIKSEDEKPLAVRLVEFIQDYDYYGFLDNMERNETEEDAFTSLENILSNETEVQGIADYLQAALQEEGEEWGQYTACKQLLEEVYSLPVMQNNEIKSDKSVSQNESALIPSWEKNKPKSNREVFDLHPEIAQEDRNQFHITDDSLGVGTPKEKCKANLEAIRILKQCEQENRFATPAEQEILSHYVGWGGLPDVFDETKNTWSEEYQQLKNLLNEEEYQAARESTLTAFYTPPIVIRSIYQTLENMGLASGNILEPSCGIGNFIGMKPESLSDCKIYGVELDSISGRIAAQLYQQSSVVVKGYEKTNLPDSFFDVAIGNVPFGQIKVLEKRYNKYNFLIHDFFFAKTLDKVRPGGVIAFITSSGTMDKKNPAIRKYIADRAELLGAIRLPNDTFQKNAGTKVTSDIIFLQKRDHVMEAEPEWIHLDTDENGITMNHYFAQHPGMILGDMVLESGPFGMDSTCKPRKESLESQLGRAITNITARISEYEAEELVEEEDVTIPANPEVDNFSYTLVDGQIYYRENSRMRLVELSLTAQNRVRGMIAIRDCVRTLIEYQTEDYPDIDIRTQQDKLNQLYDAFQKKYGLLNSRGNSMVFSEDNSYPLLCSLEMIKEDGTLEQKADMFFKRTIKPHKRVDRVDTASEALAIALGERAFVDMPFICQLCQKEQGEVEKELEGVIFREPNTEDGNPVNFLTADEYLSGNVREKLNVAKIAAQVSEIYLPNVKALQQIQPIDLSPTEITVRLGTTWVPASDVQDFLFELLDTSGYAKSRIKVHYSELTGEWRIEGKKMDRGNVKANNTYGTKRANAYRIIEDTLNLRDVRIYDYEIDDEGKKKAVLNKKETAIAQGKQEIIKQAFADWIWKQPERRVRLTKFYNETFNSIRTREYDGSHLSFSGINPEIKLRDHQKNGVARIIYGGNTLLAHVVGAGKTYTMVAAAMEMKRLGLCHKSMVVVPNHIIEQFAAEWLQLYPSANLLVATKKSFEKKNRKKFCARIATGDYDAVIIGHSQFERIPISPERQQRLLQAQIDEIMAGIDEAKRQGGERFTIKQMEKSKKNLEAKMERLNDQTRKDDMIYFEQLGVDRLFVDEADNYKNLFLYTKMKNVGGVAQTEAQKSSDMFMKCRYMDELTGGRGIIFATGTPLSNSMVELYTMQRYLQYGHLEKYHWQHFDAWASMFGETITAIELAPEGTGYRLKTRFARFHNLPELMQIFKEVADIQTADMLNLPVPKANYRVVTVKPSQTQQEMVSDLASRAERVRNGMVDANIDNMLLITNDGRKLALDQRLINELLPDEDESKVNACVQEIYSFWGNGKKEKQTQLLFSDLSTPKSVGSFNVYDDIRNKLEMKGIPREEIAFIHEATTDTKKKELFAKVRRGSVRILLGSTFKMGAGTNVQDLIVASHDLDCPWRPRDVGHTLREVISNQ